MLLYLCGFSAVPFKADRKVRAGQYNKPEVRVIGAGPELSSVSRRWERQGN